ncbi:MAG: hypothetical protein JW395_2499 [Nitrospira sp.]|nr:hypothetical protein [Nitrospira sp.]
MANTSNLPKTRSTYNDGIERMIQLARSDLRASTVERYSSHVRRFIRLGARLSDPPSGESLIKQAPASSRSTYMGAWRVACAAYVLHPPVPTGLTETGVSPALRDAVRGMCATMSFGEMAALTWLRARDVITIKGAHFLIWRISASETAKRRASQEVMQPVADVRILLIWGHGVDEVDDLMTLHVPVFPEEWRSTKAMTPAAIRRLLD